MSDMPDKGHCACKFSSGGVLSKTCAWHADYIRDAKRYRWIRERGAWETEAFLNGLTAEEYDVALDKAMA